MTQTIQQIDARAVFGTGAILAAVYAAWGALNGSWAMITGLNKAYEVEEQRTWRQILLIRMYQEHFGSSRIYGQLNAVATLLLWLYLTGAAIFISGEANSEIEKAAAEAGHPDVREAGERRSGGQGSSEQ